VRSKRRPDIERRMPADIDFDMQAAWLRRFTADAEGNLRAFALRLKEACWRRPKFDPLVRLVPTEI